MDKGRILKSVGTVSSFTALSRFLGLARDVLMASLFGTSLMMDAFVVAFTVPNLFRRLFGEGALSSAFVPVLVETRQKEGDRAAWDLVNRVLVLLALVLTLITAVVIVAAVFVPVESARIAAVLDLLKIMMPYMIFICLAAVSMGILNSFHHFAVSAFAPAILNILWIFTILLVVPILGNSLEAQVRAVAWSVLLAGFLQWVVQWPMLFKLGWKPGLPRFGSRLSLHSTIGLGDEKVRRIMRLMGPAALGMAVLQFNVVIDRTLALWVGGGAPSALFFSERLIYFPLGIIATALGTVLLPTFSAHASAHDHNQMRATISDSLRHLLFVMVPAAAGLLVLATPLVQMIFEWKNFGAGSTWMTAIALQCYAPGLVVFSLAKVFVPAFYGMQDTKTPVRIGMIAVALNLVLNITFVLMLPQEVKHAGLAFATVLSSVFNMSCLALILQRRLGGFNWKPVAATAARSLASAVLMGAAVLIVYRLFPTLGKISQIIAVLGSIAVGGAVYFAASCAFRAPELREFVRVFKR
jgi:putative peptidoglycan lipid II flippase